MKDKDSPSAPVKDALGTLEGLERLRALILQASHEIDQITRECDVGTLALHFYNAPEPKTVEFLNKHGIEWIAPRNGHGFTLVFPNRSALNAFYEQGGLIAVAQVVKPC